MDNIILDSLPKEVVITMENYFDDGKYVNDFKMTGNSKGFTISLHFCNKQCDLDQPWSPGLINKSPSTRRHDQLRRHRWEDSIVNRLTPCSVAQPPSVISRSTLCDISGTSLEKVNKNTACQTENELCVNASTCTDSDDCDSEDYNAIENLDTPDGTSDKDNVEECARCNKELSSEEQYRQNILDKDRNKQFHKIVHDTRNDGSVVYGLTDDVIFSIDEINKRYETWAIHDRISDKKCEKVFQLIHQWPAARPQKCQYGVDTLELILPDVMEQQRNNNYGTTNYG